MKPSHTLTILLLIPLLLVAGISYWGISLWVYASQEQLKEQQTQLVGRASVLMSRELGHIYQVMDFLRTELEVLDPTQMTDKESWRRAVEQQLMRAHSLSEYMAQARWLSPNGMELARVNISDGNVLAVPVSRLQDKSSRYYFLQGVQTHYQDVLLTAIDLNVEFGAVVRPYEITVRGVTKLQNSMHQDIGMLVVNYNLNELFNRLGNMASSTNTLEVLDHQGQWLLSNEPDWAWDHVLGNYRFTFANLQPKAWFEGTSERGLATIFLDQDRPAVLLPSQIDETGRVIEPKYYLLSQVNSKIWQSMQRNMLIVTGVAALFSYSALVALELLAWRIMSQRREYLERIKQDKARLEDSQALLISNNQNLILLQKELVEQSKLSALGMMVAGVGHELNTPLGGLRMSLSSMQSLLKRLGTEDQVLREHLNSSLDIAFQNLDRAVDVVVQFKRITEHQVHQDLENFNVQELVQDTLAPLAPLLKKYPQVSIEHQIAPNLVWRASPGVVSQVMQNIITNALEHAFVADKPGTVSIVASREEEYVLEISDDGKGIDEQIIAHIWEPFVTTGRGEKHTGLGLYMVHQWVTRLLGGSVRVKNTQQGAKFTITIPIPIDEKASNQAFSTSSDDS